MSFSGTQRDGTIENIRTGKYVNDINNLGIRAQLLFAPSKATSVTLAVDASRQRPDGYAQVVAGVVETKRAPYRQFEAIIADLNYTLPSYNAFDRKIDHDTPWNSVYSVGIVNIDKKLDPERNVDAACAIDWDQQFRDFTGLRSCKSTTINASNCRGNSLCREFSSPWWESSAFALVGGQSDPSQLKIRYATWRFAKLHECAMENTRLFEGTASNQNSIKSLSLAAFAKVDWQYRQLNVLPGVRFNYDKRMCLRTPPWVVFKRRSIFDA